MRPRLYDRRLGYRHAASLDPEPMVFERAPIRRWRLEKRDPSEPVSETVKPIVIYLDPNTPSKWRPWVRRGIESWQPAFEAAGFQRAIVARDPSDDPDWSYHDVRYSVLCWRSLKKGCGQTVIDPRTGEILQSQTGGPEAAIDLHLARYIVAMGALDSWVWRSPLPDAVPGALIEMVAAHEVGHMLGLWDGSYGQYAYTVEQVRSPDWVERMGFTPSIMNYARFNYVAQPEDGIPVEELVQKVGPADVYAIRWGYTPILQARSPEEERPILDAWAQEQGAEPMYRYRRFNQQGRIGPDATLEAVAVTDPVNAAQLGLRNLERTLSLLGEAAPEAEDPDVAERIRFPRLYEAALEQWVHETMTVATMLGGVTQQRGVEQRLDRWTPIPASEQRRAMAFLREFVFQAPSFLAAPELLERAGKTIEEAAEHAMALYDRRIWQETLFDSDRLQRLAEAEVESAIVGGEAPYTLSEMLTDVHEALWAELRRPPVHIDAFRQALQRTYGAQLQQRVEPPGPSRFSSSRALWESVPRALGEYERSLLHAELEQLRREVSVAIDHARDPATRTHLCQVLATMSPGLPSQDEAAEPISESVSHYQRSPVRSRTVRAVVSAMQNSVSRRE